MPAKHAQCLGAVRLTVRFCTEQPESPLAAQARCWGRSTAELSLGPMLVATGREFPPRSMVGMSSASLLCNKAGAEAMPATAQRALLGKCGNHLWLCKRLCSMSDSSARSPSSFRPAQLQPTIDKKAPASLPGRGKTMSKNSSRVPKP